LFWFILAFTSALLSAFAAISQKKILFKMDALEFSFVLAIFNMLFSLPFFIGVEIAALTFANIIALYIKTLLGALAFLNVMLAIKNLEISAALPLMTLTPGFVAIFAFIILGEALSFLEISGMILLIAGIYILESNSYRDILYPFKVFVQSKNHHYIIFALLLFTATSIMDKMILVNLKLPPYAFMAFQQIFLAVNFLLIILVMKKNPKRIVKSIGSTTWLWIILVAVITIGYRYTQIEAVKIAPVALVLSVKRTSVFFAALIGGKLFKESNLIKKLIATLILIGGAIFILQG
jgi:drug/metabolite transporter (DMT)-like permease